MTQDQIKQAIEDARIDVERCNSDHVKEPINVDCSMYCRYSAALLLRDAQLAIALEALDQIKNMSVSSEAAQRKNGVFWDWKDISRTTIEKIKEMETR